MKFRNKRILAALLAAAMTIPAFACGEKIEGGDSNTAESSAGESADSKENGDSAANPDDGNQQAQGNNGESKPVDEGVVIDPNGAQNHMLVFEQPQLEEDDAIVSTKRADDGKIYIAKTDINGATVTDANGEEATELYTGETNAAVYEKGYTPSIKTYQAYWLDISEQADFVFDGNLLEFEIKVKEDTPDGVYPVEVYFADLSNYSANTDENAAKLENVKFRPGYICVNTEQPEIPALGTEMTLTPDTISAKPGDTVRMNLRVDNNPGLVAFVIRMHYDQNAFKIGKAGAGSDLGERARLTARTLDE